MTKAQQSIQESIEHDMIATIRTKTMEEYYDIIKELEASYDDAEEVDSVVNGEVTEVWGYNGEPGDGPMVWRVHVKEPDDRQERFADGYHP
jgi:hypothetical protein